MPNVSWQFEHLTGVLTPSTGLTSPDSRGEYSQLSRKPFGFCWVFCLFVLGELFCCWFGVGFFNRLSELLLKASWQRIFSILTVILDLKFLKISQIMPSKISPFLSSFFFFLPKPDTSMGHSILQMMLYLLASHLHSQPVHLSGSSYLVC